MYVYTVSSMREANIRCCLFVCFLDSSRQLPVRIVYIMALFPIQFRKHKSIELQLQQPKAPPKIPYLNGWTDDVVFKA